MDGPVKLATTAAVERPNVMATHHVYLANFHAKCTYDLKRKSRYKGPMYVEELEEKISLLRDESQKLKSLLSAIFPEIRMEDRDAIEALRMRLLEEKTSPSTVGGEGKWTPRRASSGITESPSMDEGLETMTEATGRLDVDGQGRCEYHGDFAGLAFLHQIGERCSQLLQVNSSAKPGAFSHLPLRQAFASVGLSSIGSSRLDSKTMFQLPSRAEAQRLAKIAFNDASCLMTFIHVPSFDKLLDRIYSVNPGDYTSVEESFLPLLYITMAVGELFSSGGLQNQGGAPMTSLAQMKGINYFRASRALLDAADCRDIMSLQTIVWMIIYLQSSGSMHSCYSYISIATSLLLQMGLHRSGASSELDPVQQETRKRIFWAIQTMETYVTTLLGLPTTLRDEDIDQEMPSLYIDGDYFNAADGFTPMSTSTHVTSTMMMAAVNAHIRLIKIMRNLVRDIYPRVSKQLGRSKKSTESYRVSYARVIKVEEDLDQWFHSIPAPTPTETLQPEILRTQLLLRLAYAHVQMVLYTPFVHHIARIRTQSKEDVPEMRSFACASACIKAAMQIVWIVAELDNRGLQVGGAYYWFMSLFDKISLLCIERRRSRESVISMGRADEQSGPPCIPTDRKVDSRMAGPSIQPPPTEVAFGEQIFNANFNLSFAEAVQSHFGPQNICSTGARGFKDQLSTQQPQPALLAMMGPPPLDQFLPWTPALVTPVYGGDICPLQENRYFFPRFNAGWVDPLLEPGAS
ncbi:hypothetical protein G7Y89_g15657 [Cudoniella acicularis]|uniref:Xylanolytic transcriptional activator regulatory domain-containing protein n=1 Tax=Cudoniella acicularis TaxID=354080 RepID=A0A8H4QIF7_9HELO|nr:hypothetical protein G7Y89_g15657 [Cudoniella acicularis]